MIAQRFDNTSQLALSSDKPRAKKEWNTSIDLWAMLETRFKARPQQSKQKTKYKRDQALHKEQQIADC